MTITLVILANANFFLIIVTLYLAM